MTAFIIGGVIGWALTMAIYVAGTLLWDWWRLRKL